MYAHRVQHFSEKQKGFPNVMDRVEEHMGSAGECERECEKEEGEEVVVPYRIIP